MGKMDKKAVASAAAKTFAKHTARKHKAYSTPNYRVDVHITTSNGKPRYHSRKKYRR